MTNPLSRERLEAALEEIKQNANDLYWFCLEKMNTTMARKANLISMAVAYKLGKEGISS